MSCFGATPAYYSSSSGRPWRWWRARCAGIAAAVGSRLRRSLALKRTGVHGRRRRAAAAHVQVQQSGWCHHRSFAPVYVDDLYAHRQPQPAAKAVNVNAAVVREQEPSTSAGKKLAAAGVATRARATAGKHTTARGGGADASRGVAARPATAAAATTAAGAMRNVLLRSPGRGGGGVLGVVKGMGEVDLRAELFIRKFKEDMRLQSQRSAEEFQAMLARGL